MIMQKILQTYLALLPKHWELGYNCIYLTGDFKPIFHKHLKAVLYRVENYICVCVCV